MSEKLKPVICGCGGEAEVDCLLQPDGFYMAGCYCKNCGTKTIPFWEKEKDKAIDYAVTTWNNAMGVTRDMDEWCTDCKEYDPDKHCCPRWNKVIRKTVEEMQLSGKVAKVINRLYNGTVLGILGLADRSYGTCENCLGDVLERYTYCPHCGARLEWE